MTKKSCIVSYRFLCEATNSISYRFLNEATGPVRNKHIKFSNGVKYFDSLDKFIGDAILAFWVAPMKQENHAELAVKCALNMVKRLEDLQQKWKAEGKPVLEGKIKKRLVL